MTALLAIVDTIEAARAAEQAGAARVAVVVDRRWDDAMRAVIGDPALGKTGLMLADDDGIDPAPLVRAAIDAGHASIWLPLRPRWDAAIAQATAGGLRPIGAVPADRRLGEALCDEAARQGLAGLLVIEAPFTGRRLLDHRPVRTLADFAALCRLRGIPLAMAGALEPPDVPRLLALAPDELGFDDALRDRIGHFDSGRLRDIRAVLLTARANTAAPEVTLANDRILVRDWIVEMSIGAYARERGPMQRVRFTAEVEVARADRPSDGMAGIVSYDLVTDAIARSTAVHVDLVETLAEDVAAAVIRHPRVIGIDITVEKLDVGPGTVGCRIVRRRTD